MLGGLSRIGRCPPLPPPSVFRICSFWGISWSFTLSYMSPHRTWRCVSFPTWIFKGCCATFTWKESLALGFRLAVFPVAVPACSGDDISFSFFVFFLWVCRQRLELFNVLKTDDFLVTFFIAWDFLCIPVRPDVPTGFQAVHTLKEFTDEHLLPPQSW